MAHFQDPTPCPVRGVYSRPHLQTSSILGHSMGGLQNAKPRRPRTSKPTVGWDPTVDIFEDTVDLHKSLAPVATASKDGPPANILTEIPAKPRRRSSLFMQPAQRLPIDTQKNDLALKRRKISTLPEVDETCAISVSPVSASNPVPRQKETTARQITRAPRRSTLFKSVDSSGDGETTKMLRPFEMASGDKTQAGLTKDPRRRTIFIPSEDTTPYTIHPGNSCRNKAPLQRKPRRSDIFLEIAEVAAADEHQSDHNEALVRRPARKSLAAPPQKGPLQVSKYQGLANVVSNDRPGNSTGKENVPPGQAIKQTKRKPSSDATTYLDFTSVFKQDIMATKGDDVHKARAETNAPTPLKPVTFRATPTVGSSSGNHASDYSKINIHKGYGEANIARAPRRSTLGGAALTKVNRGQRTSTARPSINSLMRYPAINEDVSTPSLFEDNWLSHQETTITQLINGLLEKAGNPENMEIDSDGQELRGEVLALYQDQSLVYLYKRLQASLRFGGLSLPKDRLSQVCRFRDDIAQRQRFLDLWLKTYRLEYLQAAAEAVIGREIVAADRIFGTIPKSSFSNYTRSKAKSIEAFLKVFLVNNEDFSSSSWSPKNAANSDDDYDPEFGSTAWQWRRTVVRSLMLVLMLDKAKESGRFKSTLFQASSPFKSSSAVLQALSMLLLPSIGDTSRVLFHLNYRLSHAQLPLNEYDYRIRNLAIDLRDGIILTRLIENLLFPGGLVDSSISQDVTMALPSGEDLTLVVGAEQEKSWVLSQHLKHPCTSRIQKIFNVQIALSGLGTAKDTGALLEGLSANEIVDGHREKTVGLLWNLVCRWGLASLVDFEMLARETSRLDKAFGKRVDGLENPEQIMANDLQLELQGDSSHLKRYAGLLQAWACSVCRLHGITVSNLSTSFADGIAYNGIIQEYAPYIAEESGQTTKSKQAIESNKSKQTRSVTDTLRAIGCSKAFVNLFQNTSTIPTSNTTIPLLSFLASRLLPAARPHIAAGTIQRAWRVYAARCSVHKRVKLAALARDAAVVVAMREKILGAAVSIQRAWRKRRSIGRA